MNKGTKMTQTQRRILLIQKLLSEHSRYTDMRIPQNEVAQKQLLRSLMNVRLPKEISGDFLLVQDEYLREEIAVKGITDIADLTPIENGIYLWQGDITTLKCDGIVNAANSGMTGCYAPCHACIDNCIHTFAGVQLRVECGKLMKKQGYAEPTGKSKITNAYNLPCKYVLHTVEPIVYGALTDRNKTELASCYSSCLALAEENGLKSLAFCCISTGEFHFPNEEAARIAVQTVKAYRERTKSNIKIIFNVFKDLDYEIYRKLLAKY